MKTPAIFATIAALTLLTACGPNRNTIRVEGDIKGLEEAALIAFDNNDDSPNQTSDSIYVKKGKFSYDRPSEEPVLLTLIYPNMSSITIVGEPGKTIHLSGESNRLKEIEVEGTDANLALSAFRHRMLTKSPSDAVMEAATHIRSHAQSLESIALFSEYFDNVEHRQQQPALSLLDQLLKAQPNTRMLRTIDRRLRPQLLTAEGAPLPNFREKTTSGTTLSATDLRGKPALIVFVASWDGNYGVHRTLTEIDNAYGAKINVVLVALDADTKRGKSHIDNMTARHRIAPSRGMASAFAQQLGVRFVPGCLIVDAKGKIVARDLEFSQWKDRIGELLK